MYVTLLALLVGAGAVLAPGASALAQSLPNKATATAALTVDLSGNDYNGSYDCHGGNAQIGGNNNSVTLAHCGVVLVPGSNNTIQVLRPKTLKVSGNDNTVMWSGPDKPFVDVGGTANSIVRR